MKMLVPLPEFRRTDSLLWPLSLLLLFILPTAVHAQFTFTTNNGALTITRYTGTNRIVIIPDATNGMPVTSIGDNAFYLDNVTSVTMGTNLTNIGIKVFRRCYDLTTVTIGSSVLNIGNGAFLECTSLRSVAIPNSVTNLGSSVFSSCTSLTNIAIGSGVLYIGIQAFTGCGGLSAINVASNNSAYSSVNGVLFNKEQSTLMQYPSRKVGNSYIIPDSVHDIGELAFNYCTNLSSVTIPDSVTNIGDWAFSSCHILTNITIGSNVLNIGLGAFQNCHSLLNVTIPNSVTNIAYEAFDYCNSLTNVTIGSSVLNIGWAAFRWCRSLSSVTIPNSVTNLDNAVFAFCSSLTSVSIGSGVVNIGSQALYGCTNLAAVHVATDNPAYCSLDGVLFNEDQTTLIQYPTGSPENSYLVPDGVHNIGSYAFAQCVSLRTVSMPDSVTSIENMAFSECYPLSAVPIGNNVLSIGDWAFFNCTNLTNVRIPDSVTNIGNYSYAFYISGTKLTNLFIGSSVSNIGSYAFYHCTNLSGVYFRGNIPRIYPYESPFAGDNKAIIYYLPGTSGWSNTFGGRPTALWLPKALTSDANFGVRTNQFGFTISWTEGMAVAVDACTNLANPVWSPLQTNTLTADTLYFSDPQWENYSARFYRLRWP